MAAWENKKLEVLFVGTKILYFVKNELGATLALMRYEKNGAIAVHHKHSFFE